MGWFYPPHTAVIKKLPAAYLTGASLLEGKVTSSFPKVDKIDVSFCIVLAIAAWIYELEQAGESDLDPRTVAYIMEAARIAAKDIRRKDCLPYLDATLSKMHLEDLRPSRA